MIVLENPLNSSPLVFPVLECFHIVGFTLALGTIAIVDFSVLGFGLRRETAPQVAKDLAPWTLFGLVSILLTGPMMYSSDPDMYYLNPSFLFKMACLLLALVFHYTIHRTSIRTGGSKLVAVVSLALWSSVIFGGIFIAFVNQIKG